MTRRELWEMIGGGEAGGERYKQHCKMFLCLLQLVSGFLYWKHHKKKMVKYWTSLKWDFRETVAKKSWRYLFANPHRYIRATDQWFVKWWVEDCVTHPLGVLKILHVDTMYCPLLITCSPALSNSTFLSFSFLEPRQRSPLLTSFIEVIMLLEILLAFNRRLLFTSILWQDCLHNCKNYLKLLKFQPAKFFKIAVFFAVFNYQSMF